MMRVWTAAAAALLCGRHPRVGAVVMRPEVWLPIQILGPARGSTGVVGVREIFAPKQPHPIA